jgi:hypothetical protein
MAAEALVGLAMVASGRTLEDLEGAEFDRAMVAGLLLNEAIGHLRATSKTEIRAVFVTPEAPADG